MIGYEYVLQMTVIFGTDQMKSDSLHFWAALALHILHFQQMF